MSPTQRTRSWLKSQGITSTIVEHFNPFVKRRQDLFGFADLLALGGRIVAIQVTSGENVAARINKIFELDTAREWLASGGLIEVHGWAKRGARGKRKLWTLRRVAVECHGMGVMVSREME